MWAEQVGLGAGQPLLSKAEGVGGCVETETLFVSPLQAMLQQELSPSQTAGNPTPSWRRSVDAQRFHPLGTTSLQFLSFSSSHFFLGEICLLKLRWGTPQNQQIVLKSSCISSGFKLAVVPQKSRQCLSCFPGACILAAFLLNLLLPGFSLSLASLNLAGLGVD